MIWNSVCSDRDAQGLADSNQKSMQRFEEMLEVDFRTVADTRPKIEAGVLRFERLTD